MLRVFSAIAICCFVLSATASASVHFSQADLLGMTASSSNGFTGSGGLTATPTYGDGQPNMTGVAGATGNLNPFVPGGTAFVYYSLAAADLIAFNAAISSGTETLLMIGHNDNNQNWDIGIWFDAGAGIVEDFASLAAGGSSGLSLAVPAAVLDAGVFVRHIITQADDFHASWSIPEPATLAVWGGLFGVSGMAIFGSRRRAIRSQSASRT